MEKSITMQNLRNFAYCNSHLLKGPVHGVAVCMFGLGDTRVYHTEADVDNGPSVGSVMSCWGEAGILLQSLELDEPTDGSVCGRSDGCSV